MKMNVNELTGSKLDWAVAKCEGADRLHVNPHRFEKRLIMQMADRPVYFDTFRFSTDWSQGGLIIEREKINTHSNTTRMAKYPDSDWLADCPEHGQCVSFTGRTPLIAAMRCYVASKLGNEIDIPEELL